MRLLSSKTCKFCDHEHKFVPNDNRPQLGENNLIVGFYWDCQCQKQMFIFIQNIHGKDFKDYLTALKPLNKPTEGEWVTDLAGYLGKIMGVKGMKNE